MRRSDRVRLDSEIALRPERFGALAYSYRDRQLLFVERSLLPFLSSCGERPVGEIADELVAAGELSNEALPRVFTVLEGLRRRGIVHAL
jgi:putative mycofactocin binding protein MftB